MLERVHFYIQHQVRSSPCEDKCTQSAGQNTHMQSLSQSPFLSLSLSFIMYPLFTCSQTPPLSSIFNHHSAPSVCVWVSLHHVCRLMINLHANAHYKPHICPQALLTLMRRNEYGRTAEVWAWWWWSIFFHNPILHVRDGYGWTVSILADISTTVGVPV